MKNGFLLLVLFAVLFAGSVKTSRPVGEAPSRQVLAEIMRSFAWNIEEDGNRQRPVVTSAEQVGFLFDDFGSRSTYGAPYKQAFPQVFQGVGAELAAAVGAGTEAGTLPLSEDLRAEVVSIFRTAASELE